MSASAAALPPPSPSQIASAVARAMPANLSRAPLLGILGVILGAGVVTLTGRMITLGVADWKGAVGIGFDDGAWIGTAFNAALMFIGPFTVYFGALLGPRRVLLASAAAFTVICVFLPFIHSYSLLIFALVLAGLTSGTFYPLTLTFALRNIPLPYLPFTLALYATCVDGAVNIAPSLYGWYREHLSWHWMFWNSAWITPLMMLCIYYGIPAAPPRKGGGAAPSFAGFLYASAGFTALFAALDQGERLDWWRSGLFTALVVVGVFFLACALVRRMRSPNPLVDLPYLRYRNTILLAVALIFFRFGLLSTAVIIPQSLAIRGFDAAQIGPSVIWTALPQFLIAFVAAMLLLSKIDSRLLMAAGFTLMAFACLLDAGFTTAWAAPNYYRTELLMGVGQSFAFIGLVATIVLQALFSGGLSKPQWALTFSAFFHVIRLFGGEVGVSFMTYMLSEREKVHSNLLGLHVQRGGWISDLSLRQLAAGLYAKSAGLPEAAARAAGLVSGRLRLQSYALAIDDAYLLIAWGCVLAMLLIVFMKRAPLNYAELSAAQQNAAPREEGHA